MSSRLLDDGSRMPQDDLKDHPGDFPGWARVSSMMGRGCPRMVLSIMEIVLGCGASNLQDARGWHEDALISSQGSSWEFLEDVNAATDGYPL